jgi:hypothetical protein
MALKADGTVWVWGNLSDGRAGYPTSGGEYVYSPMQIKQLNSIVSIGNSGDAMFAVDIQGSVWSWGGPGYAELGDGPNATSQKSTPAKIAGLTGVSRIAYGSDSVVALKADGTSVGWGYNSRSGVVIGSSTSSNIAPTALPVSKLKYLEGITINTSGAFMGIDMNGDVLSWGDTSANLVTCDQPTASSATQPYHPTGLTTASTKMKQIAGGGGFVLLLNDIGVVKACGGNNQGQLGDGTTLQTSSTKFGPVVVSGLPNDVSFVAAGGYASAAIGATGSVYTWGRADNGLSGVANSPAKNLTPVKVAIDAGVPIATFSGTQTGALSEAVLNLGLTLPAQHVGQDGELYLAALLPSGGVLVMNQHGGFVALDSSNIAPIYQGALQRNVRLPLVNQPMDLRAWAGVTLVLGYGLGRGAAANNDLLTGANRLAAVLTFQ